MLKTPSDQERNHSVPVIVLGDGITALGVCRSLGKAGIRTFSSSHKSEPLYWSRWHNPLPSPPPHHINPKNLEEWLNTLPFQKAVLMPCSDHWLEAVAGLPDKTTQRFPNWASPSHVITQFTNKEQFREQLCKLHLPHPRTRPLEGLSSLDTIPDKLFERAFLKPHDSTRFFAQHRVKALHVHSKTEAAELLGALLDKNLKMVLQEYIPGPPENHIFVDGYVCLDRSRASYLARRRLRMFPADFGNSTALTTIPLESVSPAIVTLKSLFEATDFHGIFSAEFKFDSRDELFKIIEVNVRPWWFVDYASEAGLPVCVDAYRDVLNLEPIRRKPYQLNKRGYYSYLDWAELQETPGITIYAKVRRVLSWVRGWHAVWSYRDPLPGIMVYAKVIFGKIRKLITLQQH